MTESSSVLDDLHNEWYLLFQYIIQRGCSMRVHKQQKNEKTQNDVELDGTQKFRFSGVLWGWGTQSF